MPLLFNPVRKGYSFSNYKIPIIYALGVVMIFISACSDPTSISHPIQEAKNMNFILKKKYSFGEYTRGINAIPLKDGGYIITGYTLSKMVKDKFDSIVFDKKCGFAMRVDSNLEKKWAYVNEQRYNNEFLSAIRLTDTTFVCFSDIFDAKIKQFKSVLAIFMNTNGDVLKELFIPIKDKGSYFNSSAVKTPDGNIVLIGQVASFVGKTGYYFRLTKVDLNGKILNKVKISVPDQWAGDSYLINAGYGDLYLAGASTNFKDMKLLRLSQDLNIVWEKIIPVGFSPQLILTDKDGVLISYKDIENGNNLVTWLEEFDKNGNSLWKIKEAHFVTKHLTQNGNDKFNLVLANSAYKLVSLTELSSSGIDPNRKTITLDSIETTNYILQQKDKSLFIIGQQGEISLESYNSKLILLKTKRLE